MNSSKELSGAILDQRHRFYSMAFTWHRERQFSAQLSFWSDRQQCFSTEESWLLYEKKGLE
jgi:hypothetical protein